MSSSGNTNTSSLKWEHLLNELLEIIGKHLESRIDVFHFRAVSTSWRSADSPTYHQNHSSLTLPPPFSGEAVLSPATICRLEHRTQDAACLVKLVESSFGELQLLSPLSSTTQIPGNCTRKTLNLLDFRLIELARGYRLNFTYTPSTFTLKKVVLVENCGIVALFNFGMLWFWGFGDEKWTDLGDEYAYFDDVMVYEDQFYAIDNKGTLFWIDKCMNLVQYSQPLCSGLGKMKTLVVSDGQFYVVDSYLGEEIVGGPAAFSKDELEWQDHYCRRRRVGMKVYKLDENSSTWVEVKSLGNRVFVLGKEVSFSVSVEGFPDCIGNCIYFYDFSDPRSGDQSRLTDQYAVGRSKRFVGRVFRFDTNCIRTVECFSTYNKLFSPFMNWPQSTVEYFRIYWTTVE